MVEHLLDTGSLALQEVPKAKLHTGTLVELKVKLASSPLDETRPRKEKSRVPKKIMAASP